MNTFSHDQVSAPHPVSPLRMRDELKAAVDTALPQTPSQFGEQLIKEKWGAGIDPQTALLVTLDYDYKGHPAQNDIHQGQVGSSRTLVQTLLSNYQTVGDGRFGETVFGLYTPPDIGPVIRLVETSTNSLITVAAITVLTKVYIARHNRKRMDPIHRSSCGRPISKNGSGNWI